MPVKRTFPEQEKLLNFEELLEELKIKLINEWKNPKDSGLPIIIEDETPTTNAIRLSVIWDEWELIPRNVRTQMIMEAYQAAKGFVTGQHQPQITLAIGYDVDEAVNVGLLPYKIECLDKNEEVNRQEEVDKLLRELGAWDHGGELELRFTSREDVEKAYINLVKKMPDLRWAIVVESESSSSSGT